MEIHGDPWSIWYIISGISSTPTLRLVRLGALTKSDYKPKKCVTIEISGNPRCKVEVTLILVENHAYMVGVWLSVPPTQDQHLPWPRSGNLEVLAFAFALPVFINWMVCTGAKNFACRQAKTCEKPSIKQIPSQKGDSLCHLFLVYFGMVNLLVSHLVENFCSQSLEASTKMRKVKTFENL